MTQYIHTGKHPGHPGACIAQYNQFTYSHTLHHHSTQYNSTHHNHIMPNVQQPFTVHGYYGNPSWGPPEASYPSLY